MSEAKTKRISKDLSNYAPSQRKKRVKSKLTARKDEISEEETRRELLQEEYSQQEQNEDQEDKQQNQKQQITDQMILPLDISQQEVPNQLKENQSSKDNKFQDREIANEENFDQKSYQENDKFNNIDLRLKVEGIKQDQNNKDEQVFFFVGQDESDSQYEQQQSDSLQLEPPKYTRQSGEQAEQRGKSQKKMSKVIYELDTTEKENIPQSSSSSSSQSSSSYVHSEEDDDEVEDFADQETPEDSEEERHRALIEKQMAALRSIIEYEREQLQAKMRRQIQQLMDEMKKIANSIQTAAQNTQKCKINPYLMNRSSRSSYFNIVNEKYQRDFIKPQKKKPQEEVVNESGDKQEAHKMNQEDGGRSKSGKIKFKNQIGFKLYRRQQQVVSIQQIQEETEQMNLKQKSGILKPVRYLMELQQKQDQEIANQKKQIAQLQGENDKPAHNQVENVDSDTTSEPLHYRSKNELMEMLYGAQQQLRAQPRYDNIFAQAPFQFTTYQTPVTQISGTQFSDDPQESGNPVSRDD